MTAGPAPALAWRLFRVHPGEGGPVLLFGLLAAVLHMGVAVGFTAADALFLIHVGVQGLAVVYLLTPVVMAAYVLAHAWLLDRLGIDRVMTLTLGALSVGAILVFLALRQAPAAPTYYAAKLFTVLWWIGIYSLYWNWVDGFFDIQDAKRVYALFSAGEAMGGVAGGGLAVVLIRVVPVEHLFLAWGGLSLLAIPVALWIRRTRDRLDTEDEGASTGFLPKIRTTLAAMRASPFVLILGAVLVTGLFVVTVTEYQYLGILSEGVGEEELAALLGTLFALVSVFNVVVNLFLFNRLVLSIGVRNVALITAGAYLVAFTALLLQGGAVAALVGFFTYHGVVGSIEYNNQNFLFNAVPDSGRREARTILEGLAEPLATALGGAFLFLAANRLSPTLISTVGLGVAVLYVALVLLLRGRYGPSLVANLKRRWLDLSRPSEEVLTGLSPEEVASLHGYTAHPDSDIALAALRVLWMNDPAAAVDETLRFLRERPDAERQGVRALLARLLEQADPEVASPLVDWILGHIHELGCGFIEDLGARGLVPQVEVEGLLESDDPDEVAAAVVVGWRSGEPGVRQAVLNALVALLEAPSPRARAAGVRVLGNLPGDALSQDVARWLDDAPEVREAATFAVRNTARPGQSERVEPMLRLLSGPPSLAFPALEALARIGDPAAVRPVLRLADGYTPTVRRVAVRVLNRLGLEGVPATVAALRDPAIPYEGRVLAARSLAHLAHAQLEALAPDIQKIELARAEECRRYAYALGGEPGAGASVLRRHYMDRQARATDYVLEILSVAGRVPDYAMLRRWLRAGSAKERANALETLDQALGRKDAARLAPLLLPGSPDGFPRQALPVDVILERTLSTSRGIAAAAAAVALWERDPVRARARFARALAMGPPPILRDTILDLVEPPSDGRLGPVALLHRLQATPFFADIPLADAVPLVRDVTQRTVPEGDSLLRKGDDGGELVVVVEGEARAGVDGPGMGVGALLGLGALFPRAPAAHAVVSLGCRVAAIPRRSIEAAARRSAAVAQALFVLDPEARHDAIA